jgi:hypothetical protein
MHPGDLGVAAHDDGVGVVARVAPAPVHRVRITWKLAMW